MLLDNVRSPPTLIIKVTGFRAIAANVRLLQQYISVDHQKSNFCVSFAGTIVGWTKAIFYFYHVAYAPVMHSNAFTLFKRH